MTLLADLPLGVPATVRGLRPDVPPLQPAHLQRLGELGFLPGEPVRLVRRGPGGREPLAVLVGETLLALRWLEASCIEVVPA
ncbi:MAG: ferrous iron transport protein A [Burkholderiales bacterium]|nr:ferrous iron transport protein A [Burkholderiales bacterium]